MKGAPAGLLKAGGLVDGDAVDARRLIPDDDLLTPALSEVKFNPQRRKDRGERKPLIGVLRVAPADEVEKALVDDR